ncbi:hypothetical protein [Pectobacterium versatile]|uniref:hypothetical protein n=1 Tax=Pectobacterium versatile TaxID=2488639 RepID=UPI0032EEEE43
MKTLTEKRLNQIKCWTWHETDYPPMTDDERVAIIDRLMAAEIEVTSLKRERETMHSIEYVQGLVSKISELEAQLEELRGQDAILQVDWGEGWHDVDDTDFARYSNARGICSRKVYANPVPPAASNQDYMCDSAYIAGLKAGYNLGVDENDTELNKCIENYRKQMIGAKPPAASQPYTVPDERAAYETFIAKRLGDSIDTQRARNGDPEKPDYMAWDMTVGWIAWQGRAAMLQHHSGDVADKVNSPVIPDGYCIMPLKLTAENGAKGALSGEFHISRTVTCHECGGEGCEDCNDQGSWEEEILIGWDIIKLIYQSAVDACSKTDEASS